MRMIYPTILVLFLFSFYTPASKTKILQNGLNGYNGCVDSYIHSSDDDSSMVTQNFGDDERIVTANCPT